MSLANPSSRVHILGPGSIGTFTAHSLAEVPNRPSVTLLLHRASLVDGYIRNGKNISLETHDGRSVAHGNYNLELLHNQKWYSVDPDYKSVAVDQTTFLQAPANETIEHLIVCVKATQTVSALRPLLSRLAPHSTIMFLQNGAGMIEDVNEHLFEDASTRPNYIAGVISHGVTMNSPFDITHTGFAATSIGPVPRSTVEQSGPHSPRQGNYLLKALPQVPRFNCRSYEWTNILQIQLEKLSVNAFCNPLCALANSQNKYLFTIPEICCALMSEISSVILALPELKGVSGVAERFSPKALESTVMAIIDQNRETTCSMVWDLRAGRETEIQYINGYWARKGRDVGVRTPINDELIAKIESRTIKRVWPIPRIIF